MSGFISYLKAKEFRLLEVAFAAAILVNADQPHIFDTLKALATGSGRLSASYNAANVPAAAQESSIPQFTYNPTMGANQSGKR